MWNTITILYLILAKKEGGRRREVEEKEEMKKKQQSSASFVSKLLKTLSSTLTTLKVIFIFKINVKFS